MRLPIIHSNGTGKEALLTAATEAMNAVRVASEKLVECSPHGRDYYPYDKPGDRPAIYTASAEFEVLLGKLRAVHQELEVFAIGINEGGGKVER